ncbi:MAG: PaaX family transcriptional regulator [Herminiimonas sp.]|nr:PaaX family transcriptional regulator [Herminiimonas sp.]MDB5853919.1 PaaX family transcriptional regulator [Herminiimonas sp.]
MPSPDLVLDLLIAHERPLSARALCRSGEVMGIASVAIRVALTRLLAQKKILQPRRGYYAINRAAGGVLNDVGAWRNTERRTVRWDGAWVVVHDAAVPRSEKTAWRHHSLALALRGFAELKPGLHVRPDNLSGGVARVREQLAGLGLSPAAIVFRMSEVDDASLAHATRLWRAESLTREYERLTQVLDVWRLGLRQESREAVLKESLLLGRRVIALLIRDPLLPPEIMPRHSRRALVQSVRRFQDEARRLWREFLAEADGE